MYLTCIQGSLQRGSGVTLLYQLEWQVHQLYIMFTLQTHIKKALVQNYKERRGKIISEHIVLSLHQNCENNRIFILVLKRKPGGKK